jgi:hypothetical protein
MALGMASAEEAIHGTTAAQPHACSGRKIANEQTKLVHSEYRNREEKKAVKMAGRWIAERGRDGRDLVSQRSSPELDPSTRGSGILIRARCTRGAGLVLLPRLCLQQGQLAAHAAQRSRQHQAKQRTAVSRIESIDGFRTGHVRNSRPSPGPKHAAIGRHSGMHGRRHTAWLARVSRELEQVRTQRDGSSPQLRSRPDSRYPAGSSTSGHCDDAILPHLLSDPPSSASHPIVREAAPTCLPSEKNTQIFSTARDVVGEDPLFPDAMTSFA